MYLKLIEDKLGLPAKEAMFAISTFKRVTVSYKGPVKTC